MQAQLLDLVDHPAGDHPCHGPDGLGQNDDAVRRSQRVDRNTRNVMTIEDPVRYHMDGISQMRCESPNGASPSRPASALP